MHGLFCISLCPRIDYLTASSAMQGQSHYARTTSQAGTDVVDSVARLTVVQTSGVAHRAGSSLFRMRSACMHDHRLQRYASHPIHRHAPRYFVPPFTLGRVNATDFYS
jgi:hypothetical protein